MAGVIGSERSGPEQAASNSMVGQGRSGAAWPSSTTTTNAGRPADRCRKAWASGPARDEVVTTAATEQSAATTAARRTGPRGSRGTYAAPAFIAPYTATTISTLLGRKTPTRSPRSTP